MLLMVQKSQATTWNVQNPVNNGISTTNLNWCNFADAQILFGSKSWGWDIPIGGSSQL